MDALLANPTLPFWTFLTLIIVGCTGFHYWAEIRKAEIAASLKSQMLSQGLTVDEICRVMQAREGARRRRGGCGEDSTRDEAGDSLSDESRVRPPRKPAAIS